MKQIMQWSQNSFAALVKYMGVGSAAIILSVMLVTTGQAADSSGHSDDGHGEKILPLAAAPDSLFVPEGSAERGAKLSQNSGCAGCHGPAGKGIAPEFPKLAGQHAAYVYEELDHFKAWNGEPAERKNAVMAAQVAALSKQDMRDLAAYFAQQEPKAGKEGSDDLLEAGLALYRGGAPERGIPACIACHGPVGEGNPGVPYPRLGGQYAEYTISRLKYFRKQANDITTEEIDNPENIMAAVSERLKDTEINALAYTLQGMILRPQGQPVAE